VSLVQRVAIMAGVLVSSIGLDQYTKRIAIEALRHKPGHSFLGDTFRLQYAENDGAFLSLGGNLPELPRFWLLTVGVGLMLLGIVIFALWSKKLTPAMVAGYALIASGGLSNWVDRATNNGRVVDFMNMGIGRLRTGVFNVADLAIIAGIVVLLLAGNHEDKALKKKKEAPPEPQAS
jgi:signal peptidase II